MSEENRPELPTKTFKERFREGLPGLLDLVKLIQEPLATDPFSMGIDSRTLEELSAEELAVLRQVLFEKLALDPQNLEKDRIREYTINRATVVVYKTNQEGLFLQKMTFLRDEAVRWVLGPDQNI